MNWLAGLGSKLIGWVIAAGGIIFVWMSREHHKKRADQAERNTTAMKAQVDQRLEAEDAARIAGVEGQEKVNAAVEKAKRGDYSSLDD